MMQIATILKSKNLFLNRDEEEKTMIPLNEFSSPLKFEEHNKNIKNVECQKFTFRYLFELFQTNSIEELENFIIETIKNESNLNIYQKISFTNSILLNNDKLTQLKDFYEEECHLSLLNWIWNERIFLKYPNYNINNLFGLLALLINILNIFKIIHINSNDILELKLYEKLIKIKEFIKKWSNDHNIINLITLILNKWKAIVEEDCEKKLNKKRKRYEEESKVKSDISLISNKYNINIQKNVNNKNKIKKNIKIDVSKNRVLYFDKENAPFEVSILKSHYDPIL